MKRHSRSLEQALHGQRVMMVMMTMMMVIDDDDRHD